MRENLSFGGNLTVAQIIFLFLVRLQDLLIGATLGAAAVGVYRVAWRTTEIIGNGAIQPFASVSLQTSSRLPANLADRKRVVWGKRVSVRVDLGGRRNIKKK